MRINPHSDIKNLISADSIFFNMSNEMHNSRSSNKSSQMWPSYFKPFAFGYLMILNADLFLSFTNTSSSVLKSS
jgi:hypothetical protein